MHSEIVRRGGTGAWITATGSLPLSITTSIPERTRASTSAKLRAASASEMWMTGFAIDGIISLLICLALGFQHGQQFRLLRVVALAAVLCRGPALQLGSGMRGGVDLL